MFRPDRSGPRDAYFVALQSALVTAGMHQPTLVIDRDRLDRNLARLRGDLAPGMGLRIVAKSLPSLPLLSRVAGALRTDRFMTFNAPMLHALAAAFPRADQLLGKPFPVAAAAAFYAAPPAGWDGAGGRIGWLIDADARLRQYAGLARDRDQPLDIVLELDIGLHRGGFVPGAALDGALRLVRDDPRLRLSGMMGYDAHVASLPAMLGLRARALGRAAGLYRAALDQARAIFGAPHVDAMIRNAAGSPTFRLYPDTTLANEVSVGSALLRPTDFDTDLLAGYAPCLFVATPALKVLGPMQTPVLEPLDRLRNWLNPNLATRVFLHGGYWKAQPVDPPGLRTHLVYGRSSNQELLTGGARVPLRPDDFVFLRPTQAEAVLLQFGDIAVYADGAITGHWAPLPVSA